MLRELGHHVSSGSSSALVFKKKVSLECVEHREVMMREYSRDSCKMRDGSSVKVDQVEGVGFLYSSRPKNGSHSSVKASQQVH